MKYKDVYKQFGLKGTCVRGLKSLCRRIGIVYESYHYFFGCVEEEKLLKVWNQLPIPRVKNLTYDDFLLGDETVFTVQKLGVIKDRLKDNSYQAYGVVENNVLLYSCWIYTGNVMFPSPSVSCSLKNDECLLMDAYCNPLARGKGLHKKMNAYRCLVAVKLGRPNCIGIVVRGNTPACKVQEKSGLHVLFDYYVLDFFGKQITNFYKKRLKYAC